MRLRFKGHDSFLVGLGIFVEAGVGFRPVGGNEVDIDGLDPFDDEQLAELVKMLRDPLVYVDDFGNQVTQVAPDGVMVGELVADGSTAVTPVAADDTSAMVQLVGDAPPRSGQGATREAWAVYAERLRNAGIVDFSVTPDLSRDQIIEAVEAHRGS